LLELLSSNLIAATRAIVGPDLRLSRASKRREPMQEERTEAA
jgi:hypothetical protein